MMSVTVRRAKLGDGHPLRDLFLEFVVGEQERFKEIMGHRIDLRPDLSDSLLYMFGKYINMRKGRIFVAEDDETKKLVGFVLGFVQDVRSYIYVYHKLGFLDTLHVTGTYRRQGIGTRLTEAIERWFRTQECDSVYVTVYNNNESATALYHSTGFRSILLKLTKDLQFPDNLL